MKTGCGFFSFTFISAGRVSDNDISCRRLGTHQFTIFIYAHKPTPECMIEQKATQTDVLKNYS